MEEAIDTIELPLFPLNTVLFPGQVLPLHIFEERYRLMIRRCLAEDAPFGVALIQTGAEVGAAAEPHTVGTVARIIESSAPARWDDEYRDRGHRAFSYSPVDSRSAVSAGRGRDLPAG